MDRDGGVDHPRRDWWKPERSAERRCESGSTKRRSTGSSRPSRVMTSSSRAGRHLRRYPRAERHAGRRGPDRITPTALTRGRSPTPLLAERMRRAARHQAGRGAGVRWRAILRCGGRPRRGGQVGAFVQELGEVGAVPGQSPGHPEVAGFPSSSMRTGPRPVVRRAPRPFPSHRTGVRSSATARSARPGWPRSVAPRFRAARGVRLRGGGLCSKATSAVSHTIPNPSARPPRSVYLPDPERPALAGDRPSGYVPLVCS